jgi:formin 1
MKYNLLSKSEAIWFDVEEPDIEDDFVVLFSKQAASSKTQIKNPTKQTNTQSKQECVRLLDSKRSQAIDILMTSQRLEFQLIRDSLMNFDNQLLNFETLSSIYAIRPFHLTSRYIQIQV